MLQNGKARKRVRKPGNAEVDECVLTWFKQGRDKNSLKGMFKDQHYLVYWRSDRLMASCTAGFNGHRDD